MDNSSQSSSQRKSPLPLVAIALSAIALLATLFGPFRDYATQQRAVTDAATQVDALNARFEQVNTRVDKFKDEVTQLAGLVQDNGQAIAENRAHTDSRFVEETVSLNKSLDDKLAVTRNSIDQALRSAREEAATQFVAIKAQQNQQLQQLRSDSDGAASDVTSNLTSSAISLEQLRSRIDALDQVVNDNAQVLGQGPESVVVNGLLDDMQTWLQLANERLLASGDVEFARTALNLAEDRLSLVTGRSTESVQVAFDADLARLADVKVTDISAMAERLRELVAQAKTLPLPSPPQLSSVDTVDDAPDNDKNSATPETDENTENTESSQQDQGFLDGLTSAVKNVSSELKLGTLVTVKKGTTAYKALLTPEQGYFLRQNLYLLLQSAQLGLLRNDTHTYFDNLKSAKEWVSEYFASDAQPVLDFVDTIEELENTDLAVDSLDIRASVQALKQFNEERSSQ